MDTGMAEAMPQQKGPRLFNRNFSLLLAGQIVSNLGTAAHMTAVIWYIMSVVPEDRAGKMVAAFSLCTLLPMLVTGPLAGVLADRWNRVLIIAGTDLVRGVLFILLAAATYMSIAPLAALFGITILASIVGSLFNPAVDASIPNMVEERHLMKANSLNAMSRQLTFVAGAAIAPFLYGFVGIAGVFLINGISFFLSGVSELFIRLPQRDKTGGQEADEAESTAGIKGYMREFMDGLRYFSKDKLVMTMMVCAVVLNFVFAPVFSVLFPKIIKIDLGMSVQQFGFLEALSAMGGVLGMLLLSVITIKNRYKTVMWALFGMVAVFILFGVPLIPSLTAQISTGVMFAILGVLSVGLMITNPFVNMPIITSMQIRIPDGYRARFFSILTTFCMVAAPLGTAMVGALTDTIPAMAIFFGGGAICLIVCLWMLAQPVLREL